MQLLRPHRPKPQPRFDQPSSSSYTSFPIEQPLFPRQLSYLVFLNIIKYLPRRDLATLLRVNTIFYHAALPRLYRHLTLDSSPWPRFVNSHRSWIQRRPLANLVRRLDLHPHSTRQCLLHSRGPKRLALPHQDALPALPELQTLRIHLSDLSDLNTARPLHPEQCKALTHLLPRKLVVIGGPLSGTCIVPYSLLSNVEEYVCVVLPDLESPIQKARAISADIVDVTLASQVTVVFYTPSRRESWRSPTPRREGRRRGGDTFAARFFGELARNIAHMGPGLRVTFVNAGAVDPRAGGAWDPEVGGSVVEEWFRMVFKEQVKTARRSTFQLRDVEFLGMEEWLECWKWSDVLDVRVVKGWLRR